MEQSTEALTEMSIPEGMKLTISLFPEVMFGFVPPHLDKMLERLNCPHCIHSMKAAEELMAAAQDLAARRKTYEARRRIPIIGWFFRVPRPKTVDKVSQMNDLLRALAEQDPHHWRSRAERDISMELMARYSVRSNAHTII